MQVHGNSGFPQCPWMGPCSTTHFAAQIDIKFISQNLFVVGITQMAHKRLVMHDSKGQFITNDHISSILLPELFGRDASGELSHVTGQVQLQGRDDT